MVISASAVAAHPAVVLHAYGKAGLEGQVGQHLALTVVPGADLHRGEAASPREADPAASASQMQLAAVE